jgi:hypothetical protein
MAAALLGTIGLAAPARAQRVDGRVSLTMSGAYNQTLTDAPYPTAATQAGPSISMAPSAVLLIDTPLTNHTLTYAFSVALPFTKDIKLVAAPLTYSHRFSYSGRYTVDDLTTVSLGGSFSYAPVNTLSGSGGDPTQTPVDASPVGAAYTLAASLTQGCNRQLSEEWSLTQSSSFSFGAPIDPALIHPKTLGTQDSITLSKRINKETVGVVATAAVNYFTIGEGAGGQITDPNTQITDSLALTWTHPWTDSLSMTLNAGVTQIISPAATTVTSVQPSGSVALNYRFDISTLTAQYAHQASPNLAAGSVAFTDSATLRFSLPIGSTGLSTSGTGGFTHSAPVGGNGTSLVGSPTNVIVSDAALTYKSQRLPSLSLSLRAQLQRQVPTDDPSQGFTRVSGSLSLSYSYPAANAAQTVPAMAPALGMPGFTPEDFASSDRPGVDPEPPPEPTPAPAPEAPPETAP